MSTNKYIICDCDNFYASCERVFNPALHNRPIIILSNNDGCVVARSNEAKALNIGMGVPLFKVKDIIEKNNIAVFSSNYTLYGDMSNRVMRLISENCPNAYQYSIDEMFCDMSYLADWSDVHHHSSELRNLVKRSTGISITIGCAPTKTLAKLADRFGKKYPAYNGVCLIDTDEKRIKALKLADISDIWGIGRKATKTLNYYGITTAWDFVQRSEQWVKNKLSITGVRTWLELQGIDSISFNELPEKQSICTSRSFADNGINELSKLEEVIANFAAECSRKLKQQKSNCGMVTVFAYTNRFRTDVPHNSINISAKFDVATNNQQEIISYAVKLLKSQVKSDIYHYKKAGIIVWDISPASYTQTNLFDTIDRDKQASLANAIDNINSKNGHNTVKLAIQGDHKNWYSKCEHTSRRYTTELGEVIVVRV